MQSLCSLYNNPWAPLDQDLQPSCYSIAVAIPASIGASHVHHVDAATDAGRRQDVGHITAGAIMSIIVLSDINVGGYIQLPFHVAETG